MFNFMGRTNQPIERFEIDGYVVVDTSMVSDSSHPYETAVSHINYNPNSWIVVEMYNTEEEAKIGHQKWVDRMSDKDNLPETLTDVWLKQQDIIQVVPWIPEETGPYTAIIIPARDKYVREGYVVLEDENTIALAEDEDSYFCDRDLIRDLMIFFIYNYHGDTDFVYPIQLGKLRITIEVLKD